MRRILIPVALSALFMSCTKNGVLPKPAYDIQHVLFRVKEVDVDGKVMITPFYSLQVSLAPSKANNLVIASETGSYDGEPENEAEDEGLPVVWSEVIFTADGDKVNCKFTTENELNISKFIIEETLDQVNFKTLAELEPKGSYSTYYKQVQP